MVGPCTPDEIAKRFKNVVSGYVATQHLMSNFKIDINGDRAMCRCYAMTGTLYRARRLNRWRREAMPGSGDRSIGEKSIAWKTLAGDIRKSL